MNLDLDLLASIASGGLGHWVEGEDGSQKYLKDEDCIACLKDLQSFFRFDSHEERTAFFAVSKYNFARSDLVPLIVTYPEDYDIVYNALKVCTFLTMASDEAATKHATLQAERMQQVCEAFLAQDALAVIVGLLAEPLSRHPKMTDTDTALVELVISFLRNLLAATIPLPGASPSAIENGRRLKMGLLQRLFDDNVSDLVLLMGQHARERPFKGQATVLLEIFLHIFTGPTPIQLLGAERDLEAACFARSAAARKRAGSGLGPRRPPPQTFEAPSLPNPGIGRTVVRFGPSRQQFAGAVYIRRHMDHGNQVIVRHNPNRQELPRIDAAANVKQAKAQKRDELTAAVKRAAGGAATAVSAVALPSTSAARLVGRRSAAAAGQPSTPQGASRVREAELVVRLNLFMEQFLIEAYTPLVGQVFKDGRSGLGISKLEEEDFERFARFVAICTQYIRLKEETVLQAKIQRKQEEKGKQGPEGDTLGGEEHQTRGGEDQGQEGGGQPERSPFESISATMGWDAFHLVISLFHQAADLESSRSRSRDKTIRPFPLLYSMGPLLREMLLILDLARVTGNSADCRAADRLQRRLLHDDGKDTGLLSVLTKLIKEYNYSFHSRSYAVHLVEVLHVVLATLDRLSGDTATGKFRVRQEKRTRAGGKGKVGLGSKETPPATPHTAAVPCTEEKESDGQQTASRPPGVGSEAAVADTKAILDTNHSDSDSHSNDDDDSAIVAAKAADSVAPQGLDDGHRAGDADAMATPTRQQQRPLLTETETAVHDDEIDDDAKAKAKAKTDDFTQDGSGVDHANSGGARSFFHEVSIDLPARLRKTCAHPAMIHFYIWLLRDYRKNSQLTNFALVSFLERIASPAPAGLGLQPMLWQISVLRVCHDALSDPVVKSDPQYADLRRLALLTTRSLMERLVPDTSQLESTLESAFQEEVEAKAVEAAADKDDGEHASEAAVAVAKAVKARRAVEAEVKAKERAASLGFVELLFWKSASVAEVVRDEYNWRRIIEHMGDGTGDQRLDGGGEQLGFASYKAPSSAKPAQVEMSEEQTAQLISAFENCNGAKDCLDTLVLEFDNKFKKLYIGKKLKELGLAKGKFTAAQDARLRGELMEAHSDKGPKYKFDAIAVDLDAGFSGKQVKRRLVELGIVPGSGRRGGPVRPGGASAWDLLLGSDDDDGGGGGGGLVEDHNNTTNNDPSSELRAPPPVNVNTMDGRMENAGTSTESSSSSSEEEYSESDDEEQKAAEHNRNDDEGGGKLSEGEGKQEVVVVAEGTSPGRQQANHTTHVEGPDVATTQLKRKAAAAALLEEKSFKSYNAKKKVRAAGEGAAGVTMEEKRKIAAGMGRIPPNGVENTNVLRGNIYSAGLESPEGTPSPNKRAKALAILRAKRLDNTVACPEFEEGNGAAMTASIEFGDDGLKENVGAVVIAAEPSTASPSATAAVVVSGVKTFGRKRLMKLAAASTSPAQGASSPFEDLEDF